MNMCEMAGWAGGQAVANGVGSLSFVRIDGGVVLNGDQERLFAATNN